jgi:hypothetical protein
VKWSRILIAVIWAQLFWTKNLQNRQPLSTFLVCWARRKFSRYFAFLIQLFSQDKCKFYVVTDLSSRAGNVLNIGKASTIGIRNNHPFLETITDDSADTV